MGNALLKNYNMDKTPFSQGGFKDFWDIQQGRQKILNLFEYLAFVFIKSRPKLQSI